MATEILLTIGLILLGFMLLIKGADWFVRGASSIAKTFGVSEFVIGLTLVAFGTSVPELASSIVAATQGSGALVLGNVFGSNIANIALILGLSAVIAPIVPDKAMFYRDGYIMVAMTALLGVLFFFGGITFWVAVVLLLLYVGYLFFLFEDDAKKPDDKPFAHFVTFFIRFGYVRTAVRLMQHKDKPKHTIDSLSLTKQLPMVLFGLGAVVLGGHWMIKGSLSIATMIGMSEGLIGATVIALGTSLPELLVTITAARAGLANLAIGSVIGSNIGNILLILGVSGLITPIHWTGLITAYVFMLVATCLLMMFLKSSWNVSRKEGFVLLGLYVAFLVVSIVQA